MFVLGGKGEAQSSISQQIARWQPAYSVLSRLCMRPLFTHHTAPEEGINKAVMQNREGDALPSSPPPSKGGAKGPLLTTTGSQCHPNWLLHSEGFHLLLCISTAPPPPRKVTDPRDWLVCKSEWPKKVDAQPSSCPFPQQFPRTLLNAFLDYTNASSYLKTLFEWISEINCSF